ncbi:alpha/beta fold hydrolase [Winogradskya consettensis]|uniref:Alpha/beta hydrolase n=1 Tax=Winogradskya consettensis TaxID=113560 RepID=A0A919VLU3_9ACTN|nr:alpha/beta fold hydrolase [Actinoplanes consettensis]GIM68067.1 alpha/beta hydrolase [Actinoplanes consettensis]
MSRTVVFIHGLWIHSVAWQPWQELFAGKGYETHAPGWPGDKDTVAETRLHSEGAGVGVDEITDSYAKFIAGLDSPPIVVGHSFGGLIAQKLLDAGLATAAVAISPAPIKGIKILPLSLLRSSFPVLSRPGNRNKVVPLTEKQFAYGFGNALPPAESAELYERIAIPSPGRPLFEASSANFTKNAPTAVDTTRAGRGPLLLLAADEDHTVPAAVVAAAYRLYASSRARTDIIKYDDRGHSAAFDHGWRQLADDSLAWLDRQSL